MKFLDIWKKRKPKSHKGQHGTVLVIGGSEQYPGAVALASIAALRAGADLVYAAAPEKVAWAVNCLYPDIITVKLPGKNFQERHVKTCLAYALKADVVLVGNGMAGADAFLKSFLKKVKKPLVLDAGALQKWTNAELAILTPH